MIVSLKSTPYRLRILVRLFLQSSLPRARVQIWFYLYCPFKYIVPYDYQHHLRRHFEIKDFKCDQCGKLFISNIYLNKHYAIHEGIIYNCLLCEGYTASSKNSMNNHLRRKHSGHVGKVFTWESVEKFVKITK